jgi:hypothetical protein
MQWIFIFWGLQVVNEDLPPPKKCCSNKGGKLNKNHLGCALIL